MKTFNYIRLAGVPLSLTLISILAGSVINRVMVVELGLPVTLAGLFLAVPLLVAPVREERRIPMTEEQSNLFGIDKLNVVRSDVPAITHVDYSARLQTVNAEENDIYYDTIRAFYQRTGCPVIINTSFNVRGEPIVCSPQDAYTCFMRTEMEYLIMGSFLLDKRDQPPLKDDIDWQQEFELD